MADGDVSIVATPKDDPWYDIGGSDLNGYRKRIADKAGSLGWQSIDYSNLQDLINQIGSICRKTTWQTGGLLVTGGVLRVLELNAHGSPQSIDGVERSRKRDGSWDTRVMQDFAHQLSGLTLADHVDIYFSGCNTGLADPRTLAMIPSRNSLPICSRNSTRRRIRIKSRSLVPEDFYWDSRWRALMLITDRGCPLIPRGRLPTRDR